MSASPSGLGGIRGLVSLRMLLGNLGMTVLPDQVAISNAMKAFNEEGQLVNEKQQQAVMNLGISLVVILNKLNG